MVLYCYMYVRVLVHPGPAPCRPATAHQYEARYVLDRGPLLLVLVRILSIFRYFFFTPGRRWVEKPLPHSFEPRFESRRPDAAKRRLALGVEKGIFSIPVQVVWNDVRRYTICVVNITHYRLSRSFGGNSGENGGSTNTDTDDSQSIGIDGKKQAQQAKCTSTSTNGYRGLQGYRNSLRTSLGVGTQSRQDPTESRAADQG